MFPVDFRDCGLSLKDKKVKFFLVLAMKAYRRSHPEPWY
jgi:hypothetical protein